MSDRAIFRVRDVKQSIVTIREIFEGRDFDAVYDDIIRRAAFERFLEILSEASRSVPAEWKRNSALRYRGARLPILGTG
jgi:hypothetical protein